ncbi:MAG: hypothetical protein CM15mP33_03490 [Candidatus Neomarinimicrobiota bacterium]|nr:MAG: hypothetical protein CM15mP33_03490 [Candidatus Neomarinimicrobiota bacterium]
MRLKIEFLYKILSNSCSVTINIFRTTYIQWLSSKHYVVICNSFSMPLGNTSQSTLYGFLVGLFTDFVLFSGIYVGASSLVFSICGFWASKISFNFAFRNFDIYWISFVHLGVFIYSLFRYDFFFFNDFFLILNQLVFCHIFYMFRWIYFNFSLFFKG